MPWDESHRMDQRLRFAVEFATCRYTLTELCRRYGISRPTGFKWLQRWAEEGPRGLVDRSRAPRSCPHRTPEGVVEAVLAARRAHPHWGPRKLLWVLGRRHPEVSWPAPSTVSSLLRRHGLRAPRSRKRRPLAGSGGSAKAQEATDLWTADFKGPFRLGNGCCCFPLTVVDRASRYLLRCKGLESTAYPGTRKSFERLFRARGLPVRLLTDWGVPFAAASARAGLSRLSVWWIKLGIEVLRIEPGHPERNGAHERLHKTLKAETARPPAANLAAQQRAFQRLQREYNHQRPHEALEMKTPGERIFVSEVLAGEPVGLEEVDDGIWSLSFGPLLLGRFDERDKTLDS